MSKMATALAADPSKLTDYWNSNPGALDKAFSANPSAFPQQTTGGGVGTNPGYSYVAPNLTPGGMNWDGKEQVSWVGSGPEPDASVKNTWLQSEMDRFGGSPTQLGTTAGQTQGPTPKDMIGNEINANPGVLDDYWRNNPSELSKAINQNPGAFNPDSLNTLTGGSESQGGYDQYIDTAFGNARRLLDPYMDQERSRFEQSMINKGFAPSSEGYNTAYDQMGRNHNDLMNDAVFESMGFGASRYDKDRAFELGEFTTMDAINRAWNGIDYRDSTYGDARSDQRFNQMAALLGLTPTGSFTPYNMGASFNGQSNIDAYNAAQNNQMWSNIGRDVGNYAAGVDWNEVFNRGGGGGSYAPAY